MKARKQSGFSLTELLVVVTIVSILAAISIISYTYYINGVKDKAVLSDGRAIHRAIETDITAAYVGIRAGGLAENLTSNDTCQSLLDKIIEKLAQQNKKNPFTGFFLIQTNVATPSSGASAELSRGVVYLSCAIPNAKIHDANFYLQTCICTEGSCPLTEIPPSELTLDKDICYRL